MADVDLHKLALRLKVTEMLKIYCQRRRLAEAVTFWQRLILPN